MIFEKINNIKAIDKNNFHKAESLSKRVVKGGIWIFSIRIINRCIGFIRTIILARLLSPHDFGIIGIALITISALENLSQTGFQTALIQKNKNIESYLDTAWTVSAIRGIVLFLILFFSSSIIGKFFNAPQATLVIKIIAISTLLLGFTNIKILFFQKELQFERLFFYEFSGILIDVTVSISLAFIYRNVWALVWGVIAGNFVRLFMSYALSPYRPQITIKKQKVIDLFRFGRWILGSSILIFIITQGDDIFVGKMLGVTTLGFYQIAFMLSNLPATEITHVVSQVVFPAYSKLQEDLPKLKEAYLNVLQLISFITIPLAGEIFVLAPDFTNLFLGEKWIPIIPVIQVLVFAGLIRSIAATTGTIFHGVGKPQINTLWQTIRLIILIALIYPFSMKWNILGTSMAVLCSIIVAAFGFCFMAIKTTKCGAGNFGKILFLPLINGSLMVLIILIFQSRIQPVGFSKFFFLVVLGFFSYIAVTFLFDRFLNYGIQKLIKKRLIFT